MPVNSAAGGLWGLRQMVQTRPAAESCDLCAEALREPHAHMLDPEKRTLVCACPACALLLASSAGTRFRRIPPEIQRLTDCRMTEQQWLALGIPINLAFVVRQNARGAVVALYPSPAGITESPVAEDVWSEIVRDEPRLASLQDDVQALLIHRVVQPAQYYIAPIDACYRLSGLIRLHWKGFSGGTEVWKQIAGFFDEVCKLAGDRGQHA